MFKTKETVMFKTKSHSDVQDKKETIMFNTQSHSDVHDKRNSNV